MEKKKCLLIFDTVIVANVLVRSSDDGLRSTVSSCLEEN